MQEFWEEACVLRNAGTDAERKLWRHLRGRIYRMLLHAQRLACMHPLSGVPVEVTAPLDAEFARAAASFDVAPAQPALNASSSNP